MLGNTMMYSIKWAQQYKMNLSQWQLMLLITPYQILIIISTLEVFCYAVQLCPGGSAEWLYCKWCCVSPPRASTLEPSSSHHHHPNNTLVCCTSQPLKCCSCHNAPLSLMMGKVYFLYHDFLIEGKQTLRYVGEHLSALNFDPCGCYGNGPELHGQ